MGNVVDPVQLRPLSIGEIFDRAITLLVRNWAPLLSIAAVQVIPVYAIDIIGQVTGDAPLELFGGLAAIMLGTVTTIATGAFVAGLYRNARIPAAAAIARGFRKLFAGIIAQLMAYVGAGVPLGFIMLLLYGMGAFRFTNPWSLAMDIVAGLVAAFWLFLMVVGVMLALSSMGIDGCGVADSIGKAGGLLSDKMLGRALLFGAALTLITWGVSIGAFSLNDLLQRATQSALPGYIVSGILAFLTSPLADVVIAVFYFDVAIRREGYDLQVALDSMPAT